MKLLLSILRSAYCRSTHHYFVLDSLPLVQTDPGKRLARLLLRHHDRLLTGAKDPDTRFRDFQNHVIHVTDDYWGGAPRVAHAWYDRLQRYLRDNRFADAAHAAGVLSHYFTDPLQPLHTQHCDREKVLHRPIEWSIYRSYNEIFRLWQDDDLRVVFQLSDASGWLGEAMLHAARFANRKYESILGQYDLERGVTDRRDCLHPELQQTVAELFGLAITGLARVFERAAADAEATRRRPLPSVGLSLPTTFASVGLPYSYWKHQLADRLEQQSVARLVDEYQRTGDLVEQLPAEVDIVHRVIRVRHDEQRWRSERAERLRSQRTKIVVETKEASAEPVRSIIPFPRPTETEPAVPGCHLSHQHPLKDAPSIGPKTADRFAAIGVGNVGDFLRAAADDMSEQLATYWITRKTIVQWQRQSSLMCRVPGLRPRDAQLLVGAGCDSAPSLGGADLETLYDRIGKYCTTPGGKRYLRGAKPPTKSEVSKWIQAAGSTHAGGASSRQSA